MMSIMFLCYPFMHSWIINIKMKRISRVRTEVSGVTKSKPFQDSIVSIIVERCEKLTNEMQKGNTKLAKMTMNNLDKDMLLLQPMHQDYNRLQSLVFNSKAAYHRKIGEHQEALKLIDEAIAAERTGNVDAIDMARTLLNKSVLMGLMAREQNKEKKEERKAGTFGKQSNMTERQPQQNEQNLQKMKSKTISSVVNNLYSHEEAISLAKEALELIKNRPEGKLLVQKDQYKLGQIIIISFHNIATEMICLNNEKEAYHLYKKAYEISLRIMGPRHELTQHLKSIITKHKEEKKKKNDQNKTAKQENKKNKPARRMFTEEVLSHSIPIEEEEGEEHAIKTQGNENSLNKKESRKNHQNGKNGVMRNHKSEKKKYQQYLKVYGFEKQKTSHNSAEKNKIDAVQMRELPKLQQIYKPNATQNAYLPSISKNNFIRKNIKQIITDGKQISTKKPTYKKSQTPNTNKKPNVISSTEFIQARNNNKLFSKKSKSKLEGPSKNIEKTQKRMSEMGVAQKLQVQEQNAQRGKDQDGLSGEEKGCQLI